MLRARAVQAEDEKPAKAANMVIDALRGDALQVAMDIGHEKLTRPDGLAQLVPQVKKLVFPTKKLEAKELYAQGHHKNGVLSRQPGESMMSYIGRRKRWWILLREMDGDIGLSDEIRGDLLLEASG